jgi:uncharacterized membrane protein
MLPTVLAIAAAYFIARKFRQWKAWLVVALCAGALIGLAIGALMTGLVDVVLMLAMRTAAVCALSTWGFKGFRLQ